MSGLINVGKIKIGERYQAVISATARQIAREIKPGKEASVTPIDPYSVMISVKPKKWTTATYGSDKGVWTGLEVKKYLRSLRSEDQKRKV